VGRWLKTIRVAVALAVTTAAVLGFLDFGRILPVRWAGALARAQLVPAVLRLPSKGALVTLAVLALVTLLFGRVYCSTLCPLGTLQDVVIRLRRRPDRRRRLRSAFQRPRVAVHLAVSGAAIAIAAAGHLAPLELLEPWSSFGRVLGAIGRPIVALTVNAASRLLALAHVYALPPVKSPPLVWPALLVAVAWVVGIGALSLARGRLYCNLLCPAGALLQLLSRRTAFALTIDAAKCNGCGRCARECKARCIDVSRRRIEYAACVACFDCLAVCPKGALGFTRTGPTRAPCAADRGRRELLRSAGVVATGLLVPGVVRGSAPDPRDRRSPVVPPGAGDEGHFTSRCTACQLCVSACPTQVLRPPLTEYGLGGLLQPRLVFDAGACVYDCHRCGEVCPTEVSLTVAFLMPGQLGTSGCFGSITSSPCPFPFPFPFAAAAGRGPAGASSRASSASSRSVRLCSDSSRSPSSARTSPSSSGPRRRSTPARTSSASGSRRSASLRSLVRIASTSRAGT
jgi:polyferredoxin